MKYRIEKNCTSQREYEVNEKEELFLIEYMIPCRKETDCLFTCIV